MRFFSQFASGVERHIKREHYMELSKKTEVVSNNLGLFIYGTYSSSTLSIPQRYCFTLVLLYFPLGILPKSETKHEDVLSIWESLHQCVSTKTEVARIDIPGTSKSKEVVLDHFHHTMLGGDMLTTARARGSKNIRCNSLRGLDHLEGVLRTSC